MKILSSYSIKGGVGKTALAVNLAFALREAGHRTLLLDLDPQGAASFYFRVDSAKQFRMQDTKSLVDGLRKNIRESDFPGLDVIPSNLAYRHLDIQLDAMSKRRKQLRKVLEEFKPEYDVILMDVEMPNLNGYDASRQIRQHERPGRAPWIIALTAHAVDGIREDCLAAGMNDYLAKPIKLEQLEQTLRRVPRADLPNRPPPDAGGAAPHGASHAPDNLRFEF